MNVVVEQIPRHDGVALQEYSSLIHVIAAAARDPAVDIDKMERLWEMHEKMLSRAAEDAFNAAMNKAQSEMGRVSADAANQQTRSVYATYGQLDKAVRPIYSRNGFSISFNEGEGAPEGHARILAYVSHSAGHTRTYKLDMPNDGKGAKGGDVMTKTHATGSAHTYGRRYLLKDIFNIAIGENDDDGNGGDDNGRGAVGEDADPLEVWAGRAALAASLDELGLVSKGGAKHFKGAGNVDAYKLFAKAVMDRGAALRAAGAAR